MSLSLAPSPPRQGRTESLATASPCLEYSGTGAPVTALAFWGRGASSSQGRRSRSRRRRGLLLLAGDGRGSLLAFDASCPSAGDRASTLRMSGEHVGGVTAIATASCGRGGEEGEGGPWQSSPSPLAATGAGDGRVRLWSRSTSHLSSSLPSHVPVASFVAHAGGASPVRGIGLSPGGGAMLTWTAGGAAKLWSLRPNLGGGGGGLGGGSEAPHAALLAPRLLSSLRGGHRGWISCAALAPCCGCCSPSSSSSASFVAVTGGASDGKVCWWDLSAASSSAPRRSSFSSSLGAEVFAEISLPDGGGVSALAACPGDGRVVVAAAASSSSRVFLCDARAGKAAAAEIKVNAPRPPANCGGALRRLAWGSATSLAASAAGGAVLWCDLRRLRASWVTPGPGAPSSSGGGGGALALCASAPGEEGAGAGEEGFLLATTTGGRTGGGSVVRTWNVRAAAAPPPPAPTPTPPPPPPLPLPQNGEAAAPKRKKEEARAAAAALASLAAALDAVASGATRLGARAAAAEASLLSSFRSPSAAAGRA